MNAALWPDDEVTHVDLSVRCPPLGWRSSRKPRRTFLSLAPILASVYAVAMTAYVLM